LSYSTQDWEPLWVVTIDSDTAESISVECHKQTENLGREPVHPSSLVLYQIHIHKHCRVSFLYFRVCFFALDLQLMLCQSFIFMHIINLYIVSSSFEYTFYNFHYLIAAWLLHSIESPFSFKTGAKTPVPKHSTFQSSEILLHSANVKLHKSVNHCMAIFSSAITISVIIPVGPVASHLFFIFSSFKSYHLKRREAA